MEAPRIDFVRHFKASLATSLTMVMALGCEPGGATKAINISSPVPSSSIAPRMEQKAQETFVGVVVGRSSADLTPRFEGKVRSVHVRLGDRVKTGDLLATLDLPAVQSELRMAEVGLRAVDIERQRTAVELAAAEDQLSRREALGREALASAEDIAGARYRQQLAASRLDAARASSMEQRARIDQLRKDAATGEIRAPFDGFISARYLDPGASVTTTTRVVRLISGDELLVRFAVPESSVSRLTIGLPVDVFVGDQDIRLRAQIEKIAPEVDTASRMLVVEAALEGQKSAEPVIAGLMARVTLPGR